MNAIGAVYALSPADRDDLTAAALSRQQLAVTASIRAALQTALSAIEALPEPPLGWPTRHYDRDETLSLLREMLPDQTEREVEDAAGEWVRRETE